MSTPVELLKEAQAAIGVAKGKVAAALAALAPQPTPTPTPTPTPAVNPVIIGLNGIMGWGPEQSKRLIALGIVNTRVEVGGPYTTLQQAVDGGCNHISAILGNTNDSTQLGAIDQVAWLAKTIGEAQTLKPNLAHVPVLECINEPDLKGSHVNPDGSWHSGQKEPVVYAKMYLALRSALRGVGITTPLGFYITGDYKRPDGTWSQITSGGGWIGDAVKAFPQLLDEIDCLVAHPYGKPHADNGEHSGPGGMEDILAAAKKLGVKHTDLYLTECGQQIEGTWPSGGQPSEAQQEAQAAVIKGDIEEFLKIPDVRGIWVYAARDDGTGHWGLVTTGVPAGPLPWMPRKALGVLAQFAKEHAAA